jgi:hypothetical protein
MPWQSKVGAGIFERPLEKDVERFWKLLREHPERFVVGAGVFLRVVVYLHNRPFWMDEGSLWGNLAGKPILDFSQQLTGDQLAPIGFLIAQRAIMRVLSFSRLASRFFPLVCGISALFLFRHLARRVLPWRPALIALVMFAFSDDLIYYSSELKPYSTDLAVGLALSLASVDSISKPISLRRAVFLGVAVIAAPWSSFPSVFIVAGCGAALFLNCLFKVRVRDALVWGSIGLCWLASFVVSYQASSALLSPYTTMYIFWNFAFLPIWPINQRGLAESAGILLETFVNPLNLTTPLWPWIGVLLAMVLLVFGGVSLARRSWPVWTILALPIALAAVASALKRYPFHGRLILELVPAFFLLIAEGTEWLRAWDTRWTRRVYILVLVLLVGFPAIGAFQQAAAASFRDFNSHGDLHNNLFVE